MKKTILFFGLIMLMFQYGFSQNIDKTSKKYEAFLAEQKKNPDLKMVHFYYEVLNQLSESSKRELLRELNDYKNVYGVAFNGNILELYFSSNIIEQEIINIMNKYNVSFNTIKKEMQ